MFVVARSVNDAMYFNHSVFESIKHEVLPHDQQAVVSTAQFVIVGYFAGEEKIF
mgnify:CR=1 FL=1